MSEHLTRGIVCATLTPFDDARQPLPSVLAEHCRYLLGAGCSAIVLFGTTGEANSLTPAERRAALEALLASGVRPTDLIVGTGCCAAPDTVLLTRHALSCGIARVLVLPPFYYKNVADQGIVDSYSSVIEAVADSGLRVYLYNIPQFSGVSIRPAVVDALQTKYEATIAGIKDSSGDWPSTAKLCAQFGASLDVLVGTERFLIDALRAGASGCVASTANAGAPLLCELYARRDDPEAAALQEQARSTRAVFESYPVIAALKEVVARRTGDLCWRTLRPPLTQMTAAESAELFVRLSTAAGTFSA